MDFSKTPQEELFLQMIREFAEKEVKPLAAEIDEQERFPIETCLLYTSLLEMCRFSLELTVLARLSATSDCL